MALGFGWALCVERTNVSNHQGRKGRGMQGWEKKFMWVTFALPCNEITCEVGPDKRQCGGFSRGINTQ